MSLRRSLRRSHWDEERVREMVARISHEISDNVERHDASSGTAPGAYQVCLPISDHR
ncbi:MAG TPA: hypothetical protein VI320_05930 [Terracidiphilus sp.]|jgi:hypothetical protein